MAIATAPFSYRSPSLLLLLCLLLSGKLVEKTMMKKYGIENVNSHFISFNTICDATQ
ncbi:hypothetical protein Taro_010678, partial [Colocasia esculenta]|nr:hypothetical protein [Colocasia esculenta]